MSQNQDKDPQTQPGQGWAHPQLLLQNQIFVLNNLRGTTPNPCQGGAKVMHPPMDTESWIPTLPLQEPTLLSLTSEQLKHPG